MRVLLELPDGQLAAVAAVQTFGDYLNFHEGTTGREAGAKTHARRTRLLEEFRRKSKFLAETH